MIRKFATLVVLFGISVSSALAVVNENGVGLAYGKDHAYFLTAPSGWILDTEAAAAQKVYAVFYPKGSSWENGQVVMYSNAEGLDGRNMTEAIDKDFRNLKGKSPRLEMENAGTIRTKDDKEAQVRYFTGDQYGNYEATAYVFEPKVVVNIVMSARTKAAFKNALPAFKQLAESYKFVTDKPGDIDMNKLVKEENEKHKGTK